ncbi:Centromere V [Chlorella sorokiniana]|uniref:Centromere V n=1 Tax=Chlorella sorokiniana TaxID=3076 RepID=A0A2P6TDM2_CHLSO|nr:Centromere V [Chlorella sorokiniana]|eukprot:PRW20748.1 Centromere V [Chlorella sorokiniana]
MQNEMITHSGQCHCGAVRFEFDAAPDLVAWDCDCSICAMKRNTHCIVPEGDFRLLQGEEELSCYQFNTMTAKHLFCKRCGICPFYRPRSNPDGYAVTIYCITSPTVRSMEVKKIAGSNWEAAVAESGIRGLSKPRQQAAAAAAGAEGAAAAAGAAPA